MYTDKDGHVTYKSEKRNLGEPAVVEERKFDSNGREILYDREGRRIRRPIDDTRAVESRGRIEEVSDQ